MIEQGRGGSVVFTASISAHRVNFPQPQAAYNASKGALLQLKSSLAAEWARYGIRVNSIRFYFPYMSLFYLEVDLDSVQALVTWTQFSTRARDWMWSNRCGMSEIRWEEWATPVN